jgi:DNA (cytosine-5)-methyltransferase 1
VQSLPFTFIDLFAGIGGFRSALEKLGGRCRFSCEWDKYSQQTYQAWYGDIPHDDIRELKIADIPDHDILAAGFPCQPFSIAGVSKRQSLGMAHGFECATQGNLFFQLATIIEAKRPAVLFLENVKNLKSHDKGRTWQVIQARLDELGYWIFYKIIDAAAWVPQHRERVYIVCFDKKAVPERPPFEFPESPKQPKPKLIDILEASPDPKYTLTEHLWNYLQRYAEGHRARGNGFGFGLVDPAKITRTLSARYYKDGAEILIPQGENKPPRRLTPRECGRLMGFDEKKIVVSDTQAYRQFGNAVVPKVVEAVGRQIMKVMFQRLSQDNGVFHEPSLSRAGRCEIPGTAGTMAPMGLHQGFRNC